MNVRPPVPQVAVVERFVVVHAQIILNQFAHFPVKAVKQSAFHGSLRAALEMKRHMKLYAASSRAASRAVNRNPVKARSPCLTPTPPKCSRRLAGGIPLHSAAADWSGCAHDPRACA